MEQVVNNLIINLENLAKRTYNIEFIIDNYHEWKGEKDEFKKYVLKEAEKLSKDGAGDSVRDDKQQEVLESKWSTWMRTWTRKKKTNNKKKGKADNENIWTIIKDTHWQWMGYIF